jgi:hypothetical protein
MCDVKISRRNPQYSTCTIAIRRFRTYIWCKECNKFSNDVKWLRALLIASKFTYIWKTVIYIPGVKFIQSTQWLWFITPGHLTSSIVVLRLSELEICFQPQLLFHTTVSCHTRPRPTGLTPGTRLVNVPLNPCVAVRQFYLRSTRYINKTSVLGNDSVQSGRQLPILRRNQQHSSTE